VTRTHWGLDVLPLDVVLGARLPTPIGSQQLVLVLALLRAWYRVVPLLQAGSDMHETHLP
jgi:hypothetical protein